MAASRRAWRVRSPFDGAVDGTGSGRRSRVDGAPGAVDATGDLPAPGDTAAGEGACIEQRGEQRAQGPVPQRGAAGGAVDRLPGGPGGEADRAVDARVH